MRRNFFIYSILHVLLIGCSETQSERQIEHNEIYYVIKHPIIDTVSIDSIPPPPPPPTAFYGQMNFLLADSVRIFYHNYYVIPSCIPSIFSERPPRLFLTPEVISDLSKRDIEQFLYSRLPQGFKENYLVVISSPDDTIRNPAFKRITDYFKENGFTSYIVRNQTEEERFVLKAKLENKVYKPDSCDWKIGFDFSLSPHRVRLGG